MSNIRDNIGTVKKVAGQVWSRVGKFNTPLEYCDLEQEALHTYIKAESEWDSEHGSKKNTYIVQSITNRLNFIADQYIQQSIYEVNDLESSNFERVYGESDDILNSLYIEKVLDCLSPVARILFKETYAPSEKMLALFRRKEETASKNGKRKSGYFYMNCVVDFLVSNGLSKDTVKSAREEIVNLGRSNLCWT